jgi:hypothetical protein
MMFNVLIEWHPMIGVDLHEDVLPPAPPVPMAPHLTAATLNWIIPAAMSSKTFATFVHARIMQRGTDIQSLIPHIPLTPAGALAPVLTVFSGSKSHFGPRSVEVEGTPVAVALLGAVNVNLNCGDLPMPTGYVLAPNTVVAGMTLGDVLGGLFAMMADTAMQYGMNAVLGPMGALGGGIAGALLGSPLGFSFNGNGHGYPGLIGRLMGLGSDGARNVGETLGDTLTGADTTRDAAARRAIWEKLDKEAKGLKDDPLGIHRREDETGDSDLEKARKIPGNLPIVRVARGLGALVDNPAAEQF